MTKTAQRVTAALFCLFLAGLGLLHLLLPDRTFSPVENRNLKQLPAFSWSTLADGSYTAGLETYLADQFPLRDSWMGLKTRYERLLGKREFHGVYLCGDTLISKVSDASRGDRNLDFLHELTEKTDLPVYVGLIPTAAEIWREKLPEGAASFDQLAYLERARESGGIWVDMAGALAAQTTLPVIGIPLKSSVMDGVDALLSTVQMPSGIPVATVAVDGAVNAALLAVQILAVEDASLAEKLDDHRAAGAEKALKANAEAEAEFNR